MQGFVDNLMGIVGVEILRKVVASSKVTRRFQATLPKDVTEQFKLDEGDLILFIVEDGRLFLEKR